MYPQKTIFGLGLLLVLAVGSTAARACPFCSSVSQTFSEEMGSMDVVVIAELTHKAAPPPPGDYSEPELSTFEVVRYLKGEGLHKGAIETLYLGGGEVGDQFLTMGIDPENLLWSTPLPVNERVIDYLLQLPELPPLSVERLRFFQRYLEDEDELLARDAYDEFALAPYDVVQGLGPYMDHDQLIAWISDPNVPASHRRLYLTMLSVCGSEDDLQMLEEMLHSEETHLKAGLDAMIACYLTLAGKAGLPLVDDLFLKSHEAPMLGAYGAICATPWRALVGDTLLENRNPEYADTYSAIMALRFHGTDADVLDRQDILHSMHYMLDRPELADLVIPDLARWEDWSVVDKLFVLFRDADIESNWVRVPIINYMRACPLAVAQEYLDKFEEIDPEAVKRANTFFPRSGGPPVSGTPAAAAAPGSPNEGDQPALVAGLPAEESSSDKPLAGELRQPTPVSGSPLAVKQAAGEGGRHYLFALALLALGVVLLVMAFHRPRSAASPAGTAHDTPPRTT